MLYFTAYLLWNCSFFLKFAARNVISYETDTIYYNMYVLWHSVCPKAERRVDDAVWQ